MECKDKLDKLAIIVPGYDGYVKPLESNKAFLTYISGILNGIGSGLDRYLSKLDIQSGDLHMYLEMIKSYIHMIQDRVSKYSESSFKIRDIDRCKLIEIDYKIYSILNKISNLISQPPYSIGIIADIRFKLQMIIEGLKRVSELMDMRVR